MYDMRASRNAPTLRRAPACCGRGVLGVRAQAQGRSSGESRRRPGWTVFQIPSALGQTRTVEIGRVSPRRKLEDSGPRGSWMACRHGASPPCRRPEVQASAVEHARGLAGRGRGELRFAAASFKNSALTTRRRELWSVQASMGPIDGSHLELLRVALGLVFNSWPMQAEA